MSVNPIPVQSGYRKLKPSSETDPTKWMQAPTKSTEDRLDIDNHPVMQRWETPYMNELATVATSRGGRVLEVGFGLGISASAIQQHLVKEHIILEANEDVFKNLQLFQARASQKVTPVGPNLWQNSLQFVDDNSIDGVLYDTYPLVKEEQHTHQFDFIKAVYPKLRAGAILTYCNLTSLGVLCPQYASWEALFQQTQLPYLIECGFRASEVSFRLFDVIPDPHCEYYQVEKALVPICVKA